MIDLGDAIDIIPVARRSKAIDMTDSKAIIVSYDFESEEFKQIAAQSVDKECHCMFGPSFLVYERSTSRFLEFFCGHQLNLIEAKKIFPCLPLTQTDIDAKAAAGMDVSDLQPHGPLPLTLKSRIAGRGAYSWHTPVVVKCGTARTAKSPKPRSRRN